MDQKTNLTGEYSETYVQCCKTVDELSLVCTIAKRRFVSAKEIMLMKVTEGLMSLKSLKLF